MWLDKTFGKSSKKDPGDSFFKWITMIFCLPLLVLLAVKYVFSTIETLFKLLYDILVLVAPIIWYLLVLVYNVIRGIILAFFGAVQSLWEWFLNVKIEAEDIFRLSKMTIALTGVIILQHWIFKLPEVAAMESSSSWFVFAALSPLLIALLGFGMLLKSGKELLFFSVAAGCLYELINYVAALIQTSGAPKLSPTHWFVLLITMTIIWAIPLIIGYLLKALILFITRHYKQNETANLDIDMELE